MINLLVKFLHFVKRRKKTSIFIVILILGSWALFFFSDGAIEKNFTEASIGSVVQEVSITGRVESTRSVDLAFDRGGRVNYVGAKNGDWVPAGRILVLLDNSELLAQEQREKANVSAAESRLNQIIASSNNSNSNDVGTLANTLSKALKASIDSMIDFTDIQYKYFADNSGPSVQLASKKDQILHIIYGQSNLGRTGAWYFTALNSGLKLEIDEFLKNSDSISPDSLIVSVREVLSLTRFALEFTQSELIGIQSALQTDKNKISVDIDSMLIQMANISGQKKVIIGEGYEIEIAKSQLEQAKASLALIQTQIAKYRLVAPFSGTIAGIDAKVGQMVSPNMVVALLIGAKFQIEANVSEADIAKISVGNTANITLDAYGRDEKFTAKVAHIDPSGKIVDGLAVYKATLEFDVSDKRILSGLTADADILTESKNNVLFIPSRNVISRDGKKYTRIVVDVDDNFDGSRFANLLLISEEHEQKIFEVEIETGLKGSDGRVEVVSGLQEGDRIVQE